MIKRLEWRLWECVREKIPWKLIWNPNAISIKISPLKCGELIAAIGEPSPAVSSDWIISWAADKDTKEENDQTDR